MKLDICNKELLLHITIARSSVIFVFSGISFAEKNIKCQPVRINETLGISFMGQTQINL